MTHLQDAKNRKDDEFYRLIKYCLMNISTLYIKAVI